MSVYFAYFLDCVTKKYARFSGRASRTEFWSFYLIRAAIMVPLAILSDPINTVAAFLLLLPEFAVATRRLHDQNLSGHWLWLIMPIGVALFFLLLFFLLFFASIGYIDTENATRAQGALYGIVIAIIGFSPYFWVMSRSGTQGANRFDIKERAADNSAPVANATPETYALDSAKEKSTQ